MKQIKIGWWMVGIWAVAIGAAALSGCAATQRPPNAVEQKLFNVETTAVTRLVLETNVVKVTNWVTEIETVTVNETNRVSVTNIVPVVKEVTRVVTVTNEEPAYTFTPGAGAQAVTATGTAVGSIWGVGGIVGSVLAGLFGLYGTLRSRKANATAEVLAQVIETGRELLKTTPQGQAMDAQWKNWMIVHQAEAGVMESVVQILGTAVNEPAAKEAAEKLASLMRVERRARE